MSKVASTKWPIEPHTEAKHAILRKYLDAWLPIITRWNGRVLFIDGFAGPGEYSGGEDGSPVIAIKAALEHRTQIGSEIKYIFIEANKERYENLQRKLATLTIPRNIDYTCINDTFERTLTGLLMYLDEQKARLAPSFVFIDPFGFTGIPFSLIKRILENERCEVLITFMYEEINRFVSDNKLWEGLDATYGTSEWKEVLGEKDPRKREAILLNVYKRQLEHDAEVSFVRSFKMINRMNKTDYFLIFASNSMSGLKKMKEAMWKIDETGAFQFSDATYNPAQPMLFEVTPDYPSLERTILEEYKGRSISVTELENFILTQTPFRETHYKRQILARMEKEAPPQIVVTCPEKKRRRGTYPEGCIITFL